MVKRAKIHSMLIKYSAKIDIVLNDSRVVIRNIREDQKEKIEKLVLQVDGITAVKFQGPFVAKTGHINPFHNI